MRYIITMLHPQLSWIERLPPEQKAVGSTPAGCTNQTKFVKNAKINLVNKFTVDFFIFHILRVVTRKILFDCCLVLLGILPAMLTHPGTRFALVPWSTSRKYNLIINCANKFAADFFLSVFCVFAHAKFCLIVALRFSAYRL